MKIQEVHISEFKCLINIDSILDGKSVLLLADNERGKSSFMQFIQIALGKSDIVPPSAMGKGNVVIHKNDRKYTLNVKIKDGKSVVEVVTDDNMKDNRKGTLAGIIGAMDFDINKFVEMSKSKKGQKEQVEIFKGFLPTEVKSEILRLQAHVDSLFNERTECNRELERISKLIQAHPYINKRTDDIKQVDIAKLEESKRLARESQLSDYQVNKDKNKQLREAFAGKCNELRLDVEKFNKANKEAIERHMSATQAWEKLIVCGYEGIEVESFVKYLRSLIAEPQVYVQPSEPTYIEEMPSDAPVLQIEEQIKSAVQVNKEYELVQELEKHKAKHILLENESGEYTAQIDSERQAISDAIKDMSNPIPGLSFNDDMLLYNNIPVSPDSLSTSQIIELGVKMKMAENPELGVLFIEHGESLGKDRLQDILDVASKNNFQVIMEQVVRGKEELTIQIIGE